jgi:hypothetical protein
VAGTAYLSGSKVPGFSPHAPSEPPMVESGSRLVLPRLLESFFRRPFVCLLPLVAMAALGVLTVAKTDREFVSSGVLIVESETLLSNLTEVGASGGFSWESPAMQTGRNMNELLGTDQFATSVAAGAGLTPLLETGVLTLDQVRASVGAFESGNNLVTVRASTSDPELSRRIAVAAIDSYVNWVVDGDIGESTAAVQFFGQLLSTYDAEVSSARRELAEYLGDHPASDPDTRPAEEMAEVDRLRADVERAEDRYATALSNSENARLATEQAREDVNQRLRLVDVPKTSFAPESTRQAQILKLSMYVTVGLLLSIALVVVGAALDHSLRFPDEVRRRIGLDVLAVVPEARR